MPPNPVPWRGAFRVVLREGTMPRQARAVIARCAHHVTQRGNNRQDVFLYAQYGNRMHGRSGHLWQDRFFSCPLDDVHLGRALAYVEHNPVRVRLCTSRGRPLGSDAFIAKLETFLGRRLRPLPHCREDSRHLRRTSHANRPQFPRDHCRVDSTPRLAPSITPPTPDILPFDTLNRVCPWYPSIVRCHPFQRFEPNWTG